MKVSYGPPGHRGVTQLVAIGASELEATDESDKKVMMVSLVAAGAGLVLGSNVVRDLGAGAALGLFALRWLKAKKRVEITSPAPAPVTS